MHAHSEDTLTIIISDPDYSVQGCDGDLRVGSCEGDKELFWEFELGVINDGNVEAGAVGVRTKRQHHISWNVILTTCENIIITYITTVNLQVFAILFIILIFVFYAVQQIIVMSDFL